MSSNQQQNRPREVRSGHLWARFFASAWTRQVADDSANFDAELIAAYAEGSVTETERTAAERVLAKHPAALEMLITLTEQIADSHRPLVDNLWHEFLDEKWNQKVLADQQAFDPSLIAIYAEGNATDEERRHVEHILATSPAALDLFITLREQISELRAPVTTSREDGSRSDAAQQASAAPNHAMKPSPEVRSASTEPGATVKRTNLTRVWGTSLVTAASVVMAIGAASWSWKLHIQNHALNQQLANLDKQAVNQAMALAMSQQERMIETSASSIPPYVAEATSVPFLKAVMAESGVVPRGSSDLVPPEMRGAQEATRLSASTVLDRWRTTSQGTVPAGVLMAQASLEISLNQLDWAEETIRRIIAKLGEAAPEVRNLQALRLLALAETQPMTEAAATFAAARGILQSLTQQHPNFAEGWLNLALYLQRHVGPDNPATREAWDRYLAVEDREDLKAVVRDRLSQGHVGQEPTGD